MMLIVSQEALPGGESSTIGYEQIDVKIDTSQTCKSISVTTRAENRKGPFFAQAILGHESPVDDVSELQARSNVGSSHMS